MTIVSPLGMSGVSKKAILGGSGGLGLVCLGGSHSYNRFLHLVIEPGRVMEAEASRGRSEGRPGRTSWMTGPTEPKCFTEGALGL